MGHDLSPIVVTGARGYLGAAIGRLLAWRHIPWVGVTRQSMAGFIQCDLGDASAAASQIGPGKTIIHCAAAVPRTAADYADDITAASSLRMLDAVIAAQPRHIVFASSMTVYAADAQMPVDEGDASESLLGYAAAKRQAELRIAACGIPATILRLPGLFGPPRRGGLLFNVAAAFAADKMPDLPSQPVMWAGLHVEDAAEYCVRAALQPATGTWVLNVGYPEALSIDRAVNDLAVRFGRPMPEMRRFPVFAMKLERVKERLGLVDGTWTQRLDELAAWARSPVSAC